MGKEITFVVWAGTNRVGSRITDELTVSVNELKDIPKDEWADYVWDELGGQEMAMNWLDIGIKEQD